jgi:hypothetical protein
MTRKRKLQMTAAILAFLAFFCCSALSQQSDPVDRVASEGKSILVYEPAQQHKYDFTSELKLHAIEEARLIFQGRAHCSLFLLLDVQGPTTGGGNGACGAGEEEYLIWLDLDSQWQLADRKMELIGSCSVNIESTRSESYQVENGKLSAEYRDYNNKLIKNLTYNSGKPQKAWDIEQRPMPEK